MHARHHRTLVLVFHQPTLASIPFKDIVSLLQACGAIVTEGRGSRIRIVLGDHQWFCHRPHPAKEAKRYQVEEVRAILIQSGITP